VIFSLILVGWAINDHASLSIERTNLKKFLSDPNFFPDPNDPHVEFIERRREVGKWYLLALPHRLKNTAVAIGFLVSFLLAARMISSPFSDPDIASRLMIIATVVCNEATVLFWRIERVKRLSRINNDQAVADRTAELERLHGVSRTDLASGIAT
jgi:hypothetical protein